MTLIINKNSVLFMKKGDFWTVFCSKAIALKIVMILDRYRENGQIFIKKNINISRLRMTQMNIYKIQKKRNRSKRKATSVFLENNTIRSSKKVEETNSRSNLNDLNRYFFREMPLKQIQRVRIVIIFLIFSKILKKQKNGDSLIIYQYLVINRINKETINIWINSKEMIMKIKI